VPFLIFEVEIDFTLKNNIKRYPKVAKRRQVERKPKKEQASSTLENVNFMKIDRGNLSSAESQNDTKSKRIKTREGPGLIKKGFGSRAEK